MSSPGTPYVEGGAGQTYPQPFRLEGTRFYAFLFEADEAALRALCQRYLNDPAGGRVEYHPLAPRVLLGIADIKKIHINAPGGRRFWTPEIDAAFWVPVMAGKRFAGVYVAERLSWFLPYVFVNNAWAMAAGREIYGYPKELATITPVLAPARAEQGSAVLDRLTVEALAVDRYGPDAEARVREVFVLRRVDSASGGGIARFWNALQEAVEDFLGLVINSDGEVMLPGLGLMVEIFDFLVHEEYPLVFLKQFRDLSDGSRACYQAVVEAQSRILHYRSGGWLAGDYELSVAQLDSHPIVRELGLSSAPMRALAAAYIDFDFTVENGEVVGERVLVR